MTDAKYFKHIMLILITITIAAAVITPNLPQTAVKKVDITYVTDDYILNKTFHEKRVDVYTDAQNRLLATALIAVIILGGISISICFFTYIISRKDE